MQPAAAQSFQAKARNDLDNCKRAIAKQLRG